MTSGWLSCAARSRAGGGKCVRARRIEGLFSRFILKVYSHALFQPRVLVDLFSSMMMNSFVLFKLHDAANAKKLPNDFSSLDFAELWLKDVDDMQNAEAVPSSSSDDDFAVPQQTYKQHRRNYWSSDEGRAIRLKHNQSCQHPLQDARNVYKTQTRGKRIDLRRLCTWCGERTFTFCETCKVPLCIGNCTMQFHTEHTLPQCR